MLHRRQCLCAVARIRKFICIVLYIYRICISAYYSYTSSILIHIVYLFNGSCWISITLFRFTILFLIFYIPIPELRFSIGFGCTFWNYISQFLTILALWLWFFVDCFLFVVSMCFAFFFWFVCIDLDLYFVDLFLSQNVWKIWGFFTLNRRRSYVAWLVWLVWFIIFFIFYFVCGAFCFLVSGRNM